MKLYHEAKTSGARQHAICQVIGLNLKTIQRWNKANELQCDGRQTSEFSEMTPNQIVPVLAERDTYIASERTFYRILSEENQLTHRQKSKPKIKRNKPKALCASEPGQVLTWDITEAEGYGKGQVHVHSDNGSPMKGAAIHSVNELFSK